MMMSGLHVFYAVSLYLPKLGDTNDMRHDYEPNSAPDATDVEITINVKAYSILRMKHVCHKFSF